MVLPASQNPSLLIKFAIFLLVLATSLTSASSSYPDYEISKIANRNSLPRRQDYNVCPLGTTAVGFLEPGLLINADRTTCCPPSANERAVQNIAGTFCCSTLSRDPHSRPCTVPAINVLQCPSTDLIIVKNTMVCTAQMKRDNFEYIGTGDDSFGDRSDNSDSSASENSHTHQLVVPRSRADCPQDSSPVGLLDPGLLVGHVYSVCCPSNANNGRVVKSKDGVICCLNDKPNQCSEPAVPALGCRGGTVLIKISGVLGCPGLVKKSTTFRGATLVDRDENDGHDDHEDDHSSHITNAGFRTRGSPSKLCLWAVTIFVVLFLTGTSNAHHDDLTHPSAICDSWSVPVKANVTGAKFTNRQAGYEICCGTPFSSGAVVGKAARTANCCIADMCIYRPSDALVCPDDRKETFTYGKDVEIVVCRGHQDHSLPERDLAVNKRPTNIIAQCDRGLEVVKTQHAVAGKTYNYTACCPAYWTWLVVDEENGRLLCRQGLESIPDVHGVNWCVQSRDEYSFMGITMCKEEVGTQEHSLDPNDKQITKRAPQIEFDPAPGVKRDHSPCIDAFPAWTMVHERDGKIHRWVMCCPQIAMDAVIDLAARRLDCCIEGNCDYEVLNAQDCDDGWFNLTFNRTGKPRATICKERDGHNLDILAMPQSEAKRDNEFLEESLEVRGNRKTPKCLEEGFVPVETQARTKRGNLFKYTVCCPKEHADGALIDVILEIVNCCDREICLVKPGNAWNCPGSCGDAYQQLSFKSGDDEVTVCWGDRVKQLATLPAVAEVEIAEPNMPNQEKHESKSVAQRDLEVRDSIKAKCVEEWFTPRETGPLTIDGDQWTFLICCPEAGVDGYLLDIPNKIAKCCVGDTCDIKMGNIRQCPDNVFPLGRLISDGGDRIVVCPENHLAKQQPMIDDGVQARDNSDPADLAVRSLEGRKNRCLKGFVTLKTQALSELDDIWTWTVCCLEGSAERAEIVVKEKIARCCAGNECNAKMGNVQSCPCGWFWATRIYNSRDKVVACMSGAKQMASREAWVTMDGGMRGSGNGESDGLSPRDPVVSGTQATAACSEGYVPVFTEAHIDDFLPDRWTLYCPEETADRASIRVQINIFKCCRGALCTADAGRVKKCDGNSVELNRIWNGKPRVVAAVACSDHRVQRRAPRDLPAVRAIGSDLAAHENAKPRELSNIDPQKGETHDEDAKTCPRGFIAVEAASTVNSNDYLWTVCCPSATQNAIVDLDQKTVMCCFGPMCAWPAVNVQNCPGGNDQQMAVGNDLTRTTVCRKKENPEMEVSDESVRDGKDDVASPAKIVDALERRKGRHNLNSGHRMHTTPSFPQLGLWTALVLALTFLITPTIATPVPISNPTVNASPNIELTCPSNTRGLAGMNLKQTAPAGIYLVCCPAALNDTSAMAVIVAGADHVLCCSAAEPACTGKAVSPLVCEGEGWKRVDVFGNGVEVCVKEGS